MKKFFVLFQIPVAVMEDWKKNTKPEEMKAQSEQMMQAWTKWMNDHGKIFADKGMPLGKTKRVTAKGISDIKNDMNWYSIVEEETHDAAARIFKDHPQLQIPQAYIEVMEIPEKTGM